MKHLKGDKKASKKEMMESLLKNTLQKDNVITVGKSNMNNNTSAGENTKRQSYKNNEPAV